MLTATVIVCTSTRARAGLLRECIESLLTGERRPDELFVIVDGDELLYAEVASGLPAPVTVLRSEHAGLSHARNVGVAAAHGNLVAFVDDDARVGRRWLSSLVEVFGDNEHVLGAGGPVLPRWGANRRWMPDELLWIVGCTYTGHREDAGPIRNPIGCNMAFRRGALTGVGAFSASFGKRGRALATCDETELALRIEEANGPQRIVFVPDAYVEHFVPAGRISWRLLVRRSVSEGLAKGRLRRRYRSPALGPERGYARLLISESVPRLLGKGVLQRDPWSAAGAGAILVSLAIAAGAYVAGFARADVVGHAVD